jgi:hypothetical protein
MLSRAYNADALGIAQIGVLSVGHPKLIPLRFDFAKGPLTFFPDGELNSVILRELSLHAILHF